MHLKQDTVQTQCHGHGEKKAAVGKTYGEDNEGTKESNADYYMLPPFCELRSHPQIPELLQEEGKEKRKIANADCIKLTSLEELS